VYFAPCGLDEMFDASTQVSHTTLYIKALDSAFDISFSCTKTCIVCMPYKENSTIMMA
jgi:hypothetical protein